MESDSRTSTSTDKIAEELACWAGSGAMIIDHMARWPSRESAEMSAPQTLRCLIRDTLAPMAERHSATHLAVAAEVLADAVETLGSEIVFIDPSVLDEDPWSGSRRPSDCSGSKVPLLGKHHCIICCGAKMPRVRTTVTLDPDARLLVERAMRERGLSFKEAVNEAIRLALGPSGPSPRSYTTARELGPARVDLTKTLRVAAELEDDALARRLEERR